MSARPESSIWSARGPGDPGLMTARSLELIAAADAIFYDRLIPPGALDGAREDAELIYVGKQPGVPSVPQDEIDARLVEAAQAGQERRPAEGRRPVRLRPRRRGGRSAARGRRPVRGRPRRHRRRRRPAYAGIPVTHRDDASAVTFVTGHEDPEKDETALDWDALAALPRHARLLHGRRAPGRDRGGADRRRARPRASRRRRSSAARWPASARSSRPWGRSPRRSSARESAPGVIVVGPVAARRETRLARAPAAVRPARRRHPRPRPGQRPRRDPAQPRRRGGRAAGDPDRAADRERRGARARSPRSASYALICLTSPNGVAPAVRGARRGRAVDARALAGATVAAIGPGTRRALAKRGIAADIVPERFVAEALVEALAGVEVEGKRVLVARAAEARDVLPDALRERGAEVDVVALYETVREEPDAEAVEAAQAADYVTFTSSSTVANLTAALGDRFPSDARIVSIGPVTSEAARAAGLEVDVEAERHDIDGLLEALLEDAAK